MNRIKMLREQRGIDQKVLAIDLSVSQPTVSDWENGKKMPSNKSAMRMADYFGVSMDYLLGRSTQPNPSSDERNTKKGVKIPVLGRVAAGIPISAIEEILDYEEIDESLAQTGDFFGLQIKGNSMEPKFSNGDVVIVRRQADVDSGDIAIIMVNGDDATCKRFVKHENGVSLISTNPAYPPRFYTTQEVEELPVRVIGRVMELRAKF